MIDTDTGLQAVLAIIEIAEENKIAWAICGGIAAQIYGSQRLTKDVDFIADKLLPLKAERRLGFGGNRYRVEVNKKIVDVDWIVRSDEAKEFYKAALDDAKELENGIFIITPEWFVILKYIAGRFKDQEDSVYLLKRKGLVDRKKLKGLVTKHGGRNAWSLMASGLQRWYDLADGLIRTEKNDYEADPI